MCTLTVSDFDALDARDADAVLTAGDILASERRAENLRLTLLPLVKGAGRIMQQSIAGEVRIQRELENRGQHVPGETRRGVIVH